MIEVELPDGTIAEIDTEDQNVAASAAKKFLGSSQAQPMSFGERFLHGYGEQKKGAQQKLAWGAEQLGIPLPPSMSSSAITQDIKSSQQGYRPPEGTDYARILGNVTSSLPSMVVPGGPIAGGALAGAISGAAQPVTNEKNIGSETARSAATGGLFGGIGGGVTKLVSALIGGARGAIPGAVGALQEEGVTPTIGQAAGGGIQRMEENLASLPLSGHFIREAQKRAGESLNVAAYNRALAPIGEKVTPGNLGGDAVAEISSKLSDAYNQAVPHLQFTKTPELALEMRDIKVPGLPEDAVAKAKEVIINTLGPETTLSGDAVKSAQSQLRYWGNSYGSSANPVEQGVGKYIKQATNIFKDHLEQQNPEYADTLRAVDKGWANFKRIEKAAGSVGSEDNVFTAAQLQNAVRAADKSPDRAAFARGHALMQDLSQPAKQVMARPYGTSGTAERSAIYNPIALGEGAIAYPFLRAAYSPAGQQLLTAFLAKRPESARSIADLIRLTSGGPVGLASSQLIPGPPQ